VRVGAIVKSGSTAILGYGATSPGELPACDTARPWCRTVKGGDGVR
jgi:hypothetical protein